MKINYSKSEIFTVGMTEADSQRVAHCFNCKLGSFPMKYLVLPISDRRLSKAELGGVETKIEKRLQTWKCGHLLWGQIYLDQLKSHKYPYVFYGFLLALRRKS